MSKYGVFPRPYFPVFVLNTGKYGPEKASGYGYFLRSVDLWRLGPMEN